ncbi:MAG: 50S ribosomal protein L22 [Candidatus Tyrphobacter sp.]
MTETVAAPTAVAHLRFVRVGPRKLRRIADAIRGKRVRDALVLLKFSGVYASEPLERLVRSAMANAGANHNMNTDELYISRVTVDGGPGGRFTKRLDPRAQGRAYFKRRRLSHVTVAVTEHPPVLRRRARAGASIAAAAQPTRPVSRARKRAAAAAAAEA